MNKHKRIWIFLSVYYCNFGHQSENTITLTDIYNVAIRVCHFLCHPPDGLPCNIIEGASKQVLTFRAPEKCRGRGPGRARVETRPASVFENHASKIPEFLSGRDPYEAKRDDTVTIGPPDVLSCSAR